MKNSPRNKKNQGPNLLTLLMPYSWLIVLLVLLALFSNGLNLLIPKIIANGIDSYTKGHFNYSNIIIQFFAIGVAILIFQYLQSIVQTYASERVAKDLRERLAIKISRQSYVYIQNITPARLLTNLTSDTDAVKLFISQAIVSMVSSIFLIIGASILMLLINWELAIAVLLIIPIIGGTFFMVLGKVRVLFGKTQGVIDWLNKVINESILGSALIRVLHSENLETDKFREANTNARNIGYQILGYFALLIPIITFVASFATLIILALGGHFVIINKMTLGDFAAFNSYLGILIFPIILIGFMSNVVARASASYLRVVEVLNTEELPDTGTHLAELDGKIELKKISKKYESL